MAAVVLAAGALFAWRWHMRNSNMLSFTTAVVRRGDVVATIGATGTIEPLETVDVGAQVAGRVSVFGKDQDGKTVAQFVGADIPGSSQWTRERLGWQPKQPGPDRRY